MTCRSGLDPRVRTRRFFPCYKQFRKMCDTLSSRCIQILLLGVKKRNMEVGQACSTSHAHPRFCSPLCCFYLEEPKSSKKCTFCIKKGDTKSNRKCTQNWFSLISTAYKTSLCNRMAPSQLLSRRRAEISAHRNGTP